MKWYFMQLTELKSRSLSVLFELFVLNMVMDINSEAKGGKTIKEEIEQNYHGTRPSFTQENKTE